MTKHEGSEGRDSHWHLSKGVSLTTIGSIMATAILGSVAWGSTTEKLENLEKQVTISSTTHVVKTELDSRLAVQEYKIQTVADDVKENKETLKDVQKMMIELLQRVPKPN